MKKSVTDEYSELMHYTSATGLSGILDSQCIWSTHASHLNDLEETNLFFKERLPSLARSLCERYAHSELQAEDPDIAQQRIDDVCHALAAATLKFNEPYIFSMCGATDPRTSQHGLLSQWRAYGRDGGYAVVFDTHGMQAMIEHEGSRFHYQHLQWGDVYYNDPLLPNQKARPEIEEAEELLQSCLVRFLKDVQDRAMEEAYQAVTTLSCFYKHWGFQEEREVRLVAIPLHHVARSEADLSQKQIKKPKSFVREGSPIPYIEIAPEMNAAGVARLPIKRIIVGPHRNKEQRRKAVALMLAELGIEADVTTSDIPFTGN